MTIKVLIEGKKPEDTVRQAACHKCGSLLEFKRSDARYVSDQRDGDALVVSCPICHAEVWAMA